MGHFSSKQLKDGINLAELDTPNRRTAAKAAEAAKVMRAKTAVLRDIRHMDLMFKDDAAADAWLEKQKNSKWIDSFRVWVSTWRTNKKSEEDLNRQVDEAFTRLYDVLADGCCRISLEKISLQ